MVFLTRDSAPISRLPKLNILYLFVAIDTNKSIKDASVATTNLYNRTLHYYRAQKWTGISIGVFTLITTITSIETCRKATVPPPPIKIELYIHTDTSLSIHKNKDSVHLTLDKKAPANNMK